MNKETLIVKIEGRIKALECAFYDEKEFLESLPENEILRFTTKAKLIRFRNEMNYLEEIVEDLRDVQI